MQALNAELAASNEELRASNEEYLETNAALHDAQMQLRQLNEELEARVEARTQEVREQQTLLRQILGQTPAYIATFSGPTLRFSFFNDNYQRLLGGRAALGRPLAEVQPELVVQGLPDLLRQVYTTGQPSDSQATSVWLAQPSGEWQQSYYDFKFVPLLDGYNQPQGVLVFGVDVTEQVRARQQVQALNQELAVINGELAATNEELLTSNEELNESNSQLTRTNIDLDTFVYTASHDLRAPITNLEGLLSALQYELPAEVLREEVTSQVLTMMQGAIDRFQLTISQLTDVSRLQHAQNLPAEQVQLTTVIEDVRLDLLPLLTRTNARLTVEVGLEVYVLFAPKNLRSVVYNLLSNAVKYHHPDRVPIVALRAARQGQQVVLTVADNGLGLLPTQQQRLFGLFQRMHTHVEGTGGGLYMVKRMIENAGGTISLQSQVKVGTTFTVTLPS